MTYDSVVQELGGLIDSLDEHITIEDVGLALGELRANVFERAKAEKAHTPTDDEREDLAHVIRNAESSGPAFASTLADTVLAAGFRRSEVTEGEPSDAHLSNVSVNGVRQTWEQLYEREHEQHLALQGYRRMLSDLDRNATGRHQGDYDTFVPGGISEGNPHLTTGAVIGYDIGGREYVVPEPRDRGTLSAWVRGAGGVK